MPNLHEAAELVGFPVDDRDSMHRAAEVLIGMGARNVLVKGGHLAGDALDLLYHGRRRSAGVFRARIDTPHTHGTGCTYSAAITAELAKGTGLMQAVSLAKIFVTEAIRSNPGLGQRIGSAESFRLVSRMLYALQYPP